MWISTGILILGVVLSGVLSQDETNLCQERKVAGFVCHANCKTVAFCMNFGDKWETIVTESCVEGEFCNQFDGTCSKEMGSCNANGDDVNFSCKTEGLFPDPYNCHKYYLCYKPTGNKQVIAVSLNCPTGTAFNVEKGDCSLSEEDIACSQQFECTRPGEMHPWPHNENIFYICIKQDSGLYPSLTRCEKGYVFRNGACVKADEIEITPGEPIITTTTTTTTMRPDICDRSTRYPDENDCHNYYFCSGPGAKVIHYQCPTGSYYKNNNCVLGNC
ncbi:hypothetical protein ACFFRR_010802 [Megaselia abdita]